MESYLGFGNERLSRDGEAVFDGAVALRHDGQATPLPAPRARRQPLRERKSLGRNHRSVIATQRPSFHIHLPLLKTSIQQIISIKFPLTEQLMFFFNKA